jgi:hypothetical protein
MELILTIASLALFVATAAAFAGRRPVLLSALGAAFVPVTAAATVAVWWGGGHGLTIVLMAIGLGLPLLGLVLFAIDRIWAPFCVEMTYATLLCWVLWPALVMVNMVAAAVHTLVALLG